MASKSTRLFVSSVVKEWPKIIAVFQTLPFSISKNNEGKLRRVPSLSGLITAFAPLVIESDGCWVGWGGSNYDPLEPIPDPEPNAPPSCSIKKEKLVPITIDPSLNDKFIHGFCNNTIWPIFHSIVNHATFVPQNWKAYVAVNHKYGEAAASALMNELKNNDRQKKTPVIWIHNYQLLLAAITIRQKLKSTPIQIGLFIHIPFPQWDIFRLIPWGDQMLQGMLECNVIGFNTERFCLNFMDCCRESLGCRIDEETLTIMHVGRTIRILHLPIGIHVDAIEKLANESPRLLPEDKQIIFGIDRLDYVKGVPNKLRAFEKLLEFYPEFRGKVVLLQIVVPSRTELKEYNELKVQIDKLVGRINGRFGNFEWTPIHYIYKSITLNELVGYYRDSHVCFFTPLSDGMNLRCKEYVASQSKNPPGVLIISKFIGAEEKFKEALICNPHDLTKTADTLNRALTMPEDERILRMNSLRQKVKRFDNHHWKNSFIEAISLMEKDEYPGKKPTLTQFQRYSDFFSRDCKINKKHKIALILDYEGTIVPFANGEVEKLPEPTKQLLDKLSLFKDLHITVMSEGDVDHIKKLIGCDRIAYTGYNGLEIHLPGSNIYRHADMLQLKNLTSNLKTSLLNEVGMFGAKVEDKGCYLIYKYGDVLEDLQESLTEKAKTIIKENKFKVTHGPESIYAQLPLGWNKGRAAIFILTNIFGYDWNDRVKAIYAGDDANDEDAFKALKGLGISFQVSYTPLIHASADRVLKDTNSIFTLLQWFEHHFISRSS